MSDVTSRPAGRSHRLRKTLALTLTALALTFALQQPASAMTDVFCSTSGHMSPNSWGQALVDPAGKMSASKKMVPSGWGYFQNSLVVAVRAVGTNQIVVQRIQQSGATIMTMDDFWIGLGGVTYYSPIIDVGRDNQGWTWVEISVRAVDGMHYRNRHYHDAWSGWYMNGDSWADYVPISSAAYPTWMPGTNRYFRLFYDYSYPYMDFSCQTS